MSPITFSVQMVAEIDSKSSPTSTSHISIGALLTKSIQQATSLPCISTATQMDASVPPARVSPALVSETTSSTFKQGMTSRTKIGLGMIPVVVCTCAMWIIFIFWWRRRRAQKAIRYVGPLYIPEKQPSLFSESTDSYRKGSKVFRMAAFSTPIHAGQSHKAQVLGRRRQDDQTTMVNLRGNNGNNAGTACLTNPLMNETGLDSPIDRTSPFRLKRGDTVKRYSLGTEISSFWLSPPPPSAWVKRTSGTGRVFTPPLPKAKLAS